MNVTPAYYLCSTGFCNCRVKFYHVYGVPASDKRKLSFDTFTFDTLVFWLNFNVGLNMFFVSYANRKIYI